MAKYLGDFTVTYYEERCSDEDNEYVYMELSGPKGSEKGCCFNDVGRSLKLLSEYDVVSLEGYRKDNGLICVQKIRANINELYKQYVARLFTVIENITDENYRRIVDKLLGDEHFFSSFVTVPGSLNSHHAYIGGLLVHTVTAMEVSASLCDSPEYTGRVDKSLLLTGVFLHDIGKTLSYEVRDFDIKMASVGRQIDHATLGIRILERKLRKKFGDFYIYPECILNDLYNIILSHHKNSMVKPASLEAELVQNIDNFSAGLGSMEVCYG